MTTKDTTLTDTLETLVDKHGMAAILSALAEVCGDKANHIESNWQDFVTSKPWIHMSRRLDTLQSKAMDIGLFNS